MEMCVGRYSRTKRLTCMEATPTHAVATTPNTNTTNHQTRGGKHRPPGPYWLVETAYESLCELRQRYTEHKEDQISSVQEIIDNINREQLERGRSRSLADTDY